jgi:hypothetical protein
MNDPQAGMPPDISCLWESHELRIAALENELAGLKSQSMLNEAKARSPEEEAIREASLVRALEIAAELFPSSVRPTLETLVDPEANEELLSCTVVWGGEHHETLKRRLEWHRRVEELPGIHPWEIGISVCPPHGTK